MSEVAEETPVRCYGCVHLKYEGPSNVLGVRDMMGGTAIPIRETDTGLSPGRYSCRKLSEKICSADERPTPIVAGGECKEAR